MRQNLVKLQARDCLTFAVDSRIPSDLAHTFLGSSPFESNNRAIGKKRLGAFPDGHARAIDPGLSSCSRHDKEQRPYNLYHRTGTNSWGTFKTAVGLHKPYCSKISRSHGDHCRHRAGAAGDGSV